MIYLDDALTEDELSEAAAEQRAARHNDRWLMPDGSVVTAPSQPEGFLSYRPGPGQCADCGFYSCTCYGDLLPALPGDIQECEGGDGPCPNACQCGCNSGLYECECYV
jgi:hypothetical protein